MIELRCLIEDANADGHRADVHIAVIDVPAFLSAVSRSAAAKFRHTPIKAHHLTCGCARRGMKRPSYSVLCPTACSGSSPAASARILLPRRHSHNHHCRYEEQPTMKFKEDGTFAGMLMARCPRCLSD